VRASVARRELKFFGFDVATEQKLLPPLDAARQIHIRLTRYALNTIKLSYDSFDSDFEDHPRQGKPPWGRPTFFRGRQGSGSVSLDSSIKAFWVIWRRGIFGAFRLRNNFGGYCLHLNTMLSVEKCPDKVFHVKSRRGAPAILTFYIHKFNFLNYF
jgi:hypothetical protein